jgi:uncharacterized protein YjcR
VNVMSRERSPYRDRAFKIWCESGRSRTLASIARELGVKPEMIRKWKHLDNWDERPDPGPKRRGAPDGNRNAVGNKGGGAPKRNANAFRTGEYATMWEDVIDPDERLKMMFVETDPIKQLENEIRFLELRERRMLQLRNRILEGWDAHNTQSKSESFEKIVTGIGDIPAFLEDGTLQLNTRNESYMKETERKITTPQVLERILAIEDALTRVQDKKSKVIDLLSKAQSRMISDEELQARIDRLRLQNKVMAAEAWS